MITLHTIARCALCEHKAEPACIAITNEVSKTVAEVNGRMQRHGYEVPVATVVIDCHAFFRDGRSHG